MRRLCTLSLLGAFLVLVACSIFEGDYSKTLVQFSQEQAKEGMVEVIHLHGKALLGSDDFLVRAEEFPQMTVKLDYDFQIGKHEVTCGEFNHLMQKSMGVSVPCETDNLPATDVTYYDAVLFANERSKSEKLDTAYTYKSRTFDAEGHCIELENFLYNPEADAYRLPTEAEWILVASKNWEKKTAWTAENSDYRIHEVCSNIGWEDEVCDMVGNAMEWVNDRMGYLQKKTVTNFVGASDDGGMGKRIVKGGSFRNTFNSIKIYNRGDVYTITSSTRANYVGFRLAYGAIPRAEWMDANGTVTSSPIDILVSAKDVQNLLGVYKAKLAFRNDLTGNLAILDFSSGLPSMLEFADTMEVFHPEISPNGKLVAYCTGMEGVSGESRVYVRDVYGLRKKLYRLNVEQAAIPRWRVLDNGDTAIVYVSDAGNNKNESTFKSGETWQVVFKNGRFKKPEKILDGSYHDGISKDSKLAVTGARLLRARLADSSSTIFSMARDTVWYNGEQACNASLALDGSKRTLFLDFGSKTGQDFVGEAYGTHQRLLIVDSTGSLIHSVGAPAGYSFDHTEWVRGSSRYVMATLANSQGAHTKISLVDTESGDVLDMLEGDELWHPSLWIPDYIDKSKYELDLDSAGVYMLQGVDLVSMLMRYNMEFLWRYKDTANTVILGSSRPLNSVGPQYFNSRFFALNLAQTPNSMYMSRDFLDFYVFPHVKNLKYIVLSLDIDFWWKEDGDKGDNFFAKKYENYPGFVYDKNHDYWQSGVPEGLLELTQNYMAVSNEESYVSDRGRVTNVPCYSWDEVALVDFDSTYFDDREYLLENTMNVLKEIIEKSKKKNVYVVGVIFPLNPKYKKTGAFGRYGLRRSRATKLIKQLKKLETEYPNFRFMDENKMGDHDYEDDLANNSDHLCSRGAPKLTKRLDSLLKTLE